LLQAAKSSDRLVCDSFPMDKSIRVTALQVTDWGVVLDGEGHPARAGFRWSEDMRSTLEEFYHSLIWEYEMIVSDCAADGSAIPGTKRTVWVRDLAANESSSVPKQVPPAGSSKVQFQVKRQS
jgi:hypothetical protein